MQTSYSLLGAGTQVIALFQESRPGRVIKIPRDDRYLPRRWQRRIGYAKHRFGKRRDTQPWPVALGLAVRDAITGREAKERKADFEELLPKLQRIKGEDAVKRFFAEFDVLASTHVSHIDGRQVEYFGPAIVQAKAARMFAPESLSDLNDKDFAAFMKIPLLAVHQTLWRNGLGFAATGEAWGPENWGIDEKGRVVLFDLGSITDRQHRAIAVVSSRAADRVEGILKRHVRADLVDLHFKKVRRELNPELLQQVWRPFEPQQRSGTDGQPDGSPQ